ncbi:U-scoloptoxin(01)-Cw1a-like [Tachypleus tridentatus]|uniref:U-scoloptoxin(01)-Cw1a-like n=1 Tax=Tachypleus tridentatus TaxID=6853 RepID=UPI003FD39FA8
MEEGCKAERKTFELPDQVKIILGPINTDFSCDGRHPGYYADTKSNCQVFHICYSRTLTDGTLQAERQSFFCGNQTVFNQLSLTCTFPNDAVPCTEASDFYYLNENIGIKDAPFFTDEDIIKGAKAINTQ